MDQKELIAALMAAAETPVSHVDLSASTQRIKVDMDTRKITGHKEFGVIKDHLAENIIFEVKRYKGDTDLAEKHCAIHWENGKNGGVVPVTEIDLSEDGHILMRWELSDEFTQYAGSIAYALHFFSILDGGFTYHAATNAAVGTLGTTLNASTHSKNKITPSEIEVYIAKMNELSAAMDEQVVLAQEAATKAESIAEQLAEKIAKVEELTQKTEINKNDISKLSGEIANINEVIDIAFMTNKVEFEQGFWAVATGEGDSTNINWIRSKEDVSSETLSLHVRDESDIVVFVVAWDGLNFLGAWTGSDWTTTYSLELGRKDIDFDTIRALYPSCKMRLSAKKYSGSPITVSESDQIEISYSVTSFEDVITDRIEYMYLFHKIGVIGDSLSSGEISFSSNEGEQYIDCYEYSWLSNICRVTNAIPVHYSKGGLTTKSWLSSEYKTQFDSDEKCGCYFIALGTNDRNANYGIGNITDESGSDTFCGYYKQIIELIKSKNPNAIIFVLSLYSNNSTFVPYNNIISSIADIYDNCYFVDFANNSNIHNTDGSTEFTSYGHFTPIGYLVVANTIRKLVNKIVKNNRNTNFIKFFYPVNNKNS